MATHRDTFNTYIRAEFEKQMRAWEKMSNKTLIQWTTGEHKDAGIHINMGRMLCNFKLDNTDSLSVGTVEEVEKWLGEEVEE